MRYLNVVTEAELAHHFVQSNGLSLPGSGQALVDLVETWLRRRGLEHRLPDSVAIASEVLTVIQQVRANQARVAEQEFAADVREGWGDQRYTDRQAMQQMDELALAQHVSDTSMADWGSERIRLGIAPKSTFDHLAETGQ